RGHFATLLKPDGAEIAAIWRLKACGSIHDGRRGIFLAELLGGAFAIVVFLEMLPDEIGCDLFGGLDLKRNTARPQIAAVDGFVRLFVERIAVAFGPF